MKTPLQMAFDKWLEENNAQAAVLIKAPLGGQVTPENFIPQGWGSGGYTVTFGAEFDTGTGFTASTTVGHYSTIRFRWTGAKWVKTGEMIGV